MRSPRESRLRAFAAKVRGSLRGHRHDGEFDEEMQEHLQLLAEKFVAQGMTKQEAAAAARRQFGNMTLLQEDHRELQAFLSLEELWRDLRYGLRMLGKSRGFTTVAVLTLALGIGANTAVFSLIDALLLRSLDVPAPRELVRISFGPPGNAGPLSSPMFDRLRERQSAFTDLFAWKNSPMVLTENGVARPITGAYATGSAFPTLRLKPRLGRLLTWQDDEPDAISNGI